MNKLLIVWLLVTITWACVDSEAVEQGSPSLYCADLHPQNSVDIEQITGMWYGSELLQHHEGYEDESTSSSCVVVHLSEITDQMTTTPRSDRRDDSYGGYYSPDRFNNQPTAHRYNYMQLLWDENGIILEYTLRYNRTRRGFWISSSPKKSGSLQDLSYNQFTGTLQVMKAVSDHMVLTFCQTLPKGQLFSIVLSRRPDGLTGDERQSVRSLLKRHSLPTASIKRLCSGSASNTLSISMAVFVLALILKPSFTNL